MDVFIGSVDDNLLSHHLWWGPVCHIRGYNPLLQSHNRFSEVGYRIVTHMLGANQEVTHRRDSRWNRL
jgi:hypothetical protein